MKTTEEFVKESSEKFGNKFNYSLVNYKGAFVKIDIICNSCGNIFKQTPDRHLRNDSNGNKICSFCVMDRLKNSFITKAKIIHEDRYNYDDMDFKAVQSKINIKCNTCENYFSIRPHDHISNMQGCSKCKFSKGEFKISKFLKNNCIKFSTQKTFEGCRNKNPLRFDFYLIDYNICIEYDGIQHFTPFSYRANATMEDKLKKLESTQFNDNIKNLYCKENDIKLIRINNSHIIEDELSFLLS